MVKICPICHSDNVDVWLGRGGGNMYKCLNCGFHEAIFIEADVKEVKKLEGKRS